jgi:flagellar biosynthetic protein FliR
MTPLADHAHQLWLPELFGYMVVFMRFTGLIFMMPGLSESYVRPQVRLWLAATLALVVTPLIDHLPVFPNHAVIFVGIIVFEFFIGFFLGLIIRILLSSLDVAGALIGFQMNLSNAFAEGSASSQQVALPGVFLGMVAVVLMFAFNLHPIIIKGLLNSYAVFPAGLAFDYTAFMGDSSVLMIQTLQQSFVLAVQIAAPVIVLTFLVFVGGGIVSRLVPQIQIFFVLQPLQILIGFGALCAAFTVIMPHFMQAFTDALITFFQVKE